MIRFNKLNRSFGETSVLKDVSFEIQTGELVCIIGASGCGKTTLLKLINRLLEPSSGSMFTNLLGHDPISDKQQVYDTIYEELLEQYDVTALPMMNYNNTFTLAVTPETAEEYDLTTLSDLAAVSDRFILGAELEFFNRQDGLVGLRSTYGMNFREELGVVGSNRYTALETGSCDVINAYSTDGLLKKFGLVCLEDDKNFFVPYFATPMFRTETLERYP